MTGYRINSLVHGVVTPPIAEVQSWIGNRRFPPDRPLLDVAQAVPSYGPAQPLLDHLASRLQDPSTAQYTDILGLPELRSALAAHLSADYEGVVAAEEVAITAGCNQAFCVAMDLLAQPGDEVVLLLPYYFNHHMWLQMRGIGERYVPYTQDGPPSTDTIASCMTSKTRAVVLISPNNPTGIEYARDYIEALFELARSHGIALVIDETYKDFRTTTGPPHQLMQRSDWDQNLIQLFSFSKSYALTGYRVGAMVANAETNREVAKILDNLAICPPHIGQLAALYGLRHMGEWRQQKAGMLRDRVVRLRECFTNRGLRYELVSSGAYFAYLRHPFTGQTAHSVAHRLADDFNILCLPGSMFGPGQEAYLRFAFANIDGSHIPELVSRLMESQQ